MYSPEERRQIGSIVRIIASAGTAFLYLAHAFWLLLVFSADALGAFLLIPVHFGIAVGIGVGTFFCLKWARTWSRVAAVGACLSVVVVLAGLVIFPARQYEPGPFGQMAQYYSVFQRYPEDIEYDDAFYGNRAEQAAAKVKYPNAPDTFLILVFSEEECWIGCRDGNIVSYDASQIQVSDDGSNMVVIVTHPTDSIRQTAHDVAKADLKQAADKSITIKRDTYSVYPRPGHDWLFTDPPESDLLPDGMRQVILDPTTGDDIFKWLLQNSK